MRRAKPSSGGRSTRWSWWVRHRLRSPALYWAAAVAIGLLTASTVARTLHEAEVARDRYVHWTSVAVATRDLAAGTLLVEGDVRMTRLPSSMVPRTAWRRPPVGHRVRDDVTSGEVLVRGRTATTSSATASRVGTGDRAVGIPVSEPAMALQPGDHVDVEVLDPAGTGYEPAAEDVEVVAVVEGLVTVSIPADAVGEVIGAVAAGTAQLALRGG